MSKGIKTQRPTSATLIISLILWVIGILSTVFGVIGLPNNLGVWSLVVAGALMILGSLFNNI